MNPVETLEVAVWNVQKEIELTEGHPDPMLDANLAILNRALVLAKRGHKDTLKLELALAEAWL